MCGIIGYLGERQATPILMESLKRLEYRGYDSAGVAVIETGDGTRHTSVTKSEAKVDLLIAKLKENMPTGTVGIGHTRWATHGKPTIINAHPHADCHGRISVVHNGIIENFAEIKAELESLGHEFTSETDTEVVPHLIEQYYKGDFLLAVRKALQRIKGAYALAMFSLDDPELLVGARLNAPLVVGIGEGEYFIASDITAIIPYTKKVLILGEGEMAAVTPLGPEVSTLDGQPVDAKIVHVDWDVSQAEKGGFPHFMLKEIHETPEAAANVFASSAARDSDGAIYLHSGPEIGVASTKTLVAHLVTQYLLALRLATAHGRVSLERREELARGLRELPDKIRRVLDNSTDIARLAHKYSRFRNFMFVGRGINHGVALEGALKLKEISYLHAEGSSGGELKHGPIALLDPDFPVVAVCTESSTREKMASTVHEIVARDAPVLALVSEGDGSLDDIVTDQIVIPAADEATSAVLSTVALQLFAYHVANELGRDVDQPRNLAKSVTVE